MPWQKRERQNEKMVTICSHIVNKIYMVLSTFQLFPNELSKDTKSQGSLYY